MLLCIWKQRWKKDIAKAKQFLSVVSLLQCYEKCLIRARLSRKYSPWKYKPNSEIKPLIAVQRKLCWYRYEITSRMKLMWRMLLKNWFSYLDWRRRGGEEEKRWGGEDVTEIGPKFGICPGWGRSCTQLPTAPSQYICLIHYTWEHYR